jgi:hypothetical protein
MSRACAAAHIEIRAHDRNRKFEEQNSIDTYESKATIKVMKRAQNRSSTVPEVNKGIVNGQ